MPILATMFVKLLNFLMLCQLRVASQARIFGSGSGLMLTKISGLIWA